MALAPRRHQAPRQRRAACSPGPTTRATLQCHRGQGLALFDDPRLFLLDAFPAPPSGSSDGDGEEEAGAGARTAQDRVREGSPEERPPPFAVTVSTMSGQTCQIADLEPDELVSELRTKAALQFGLPAASTWLCLGTCVLGGAEGSKTLLEAGLHEGARLTCVVAPGVAFGKRRYALTQRRFSEDEDLLAAARAEHGEKASLANFEDLSSSDPVVCEAFLNGLGLHGGAFVLHKGQSSRLGDQGHYFVCRHGGAIPRAWLAQVDDDGEDGLDDVRNNRLDLCLMPGRLLPVLVDLGAL